MLAIWSYFAWTQGFGRSKGVISNHWFIFVQYTLARGWIYGLYVIYLSSTLRLQCSLLTLALLSRVFTKTGNTGVRTPILFHSPMSLPPPIPNQPLKGKRLNGGSNGPWVSPRRIAEKRSRRLWYWERVEWGWAETTLQVRLWRLVPSYRDLHMRPPGVGKPSHSVGDVN